MASKKVVNRRAEASAAAKRLAKSSSDFKVVYDFLLKKSGVGKSPFSEKGAEDTARQIGRQEQHQMLIDLVNGKKGDDE